MKYIVRRYAWSYLLFVCVIRFCLLQETQKFRAELLKKLSKDKETFRDDLDKVVDVCSEVNFLLFIAYLLDLGFL